MKTGRKKSIDHSSALGQASITHWLVLTPQVHASTQVKMLAEAIVPGWSLATMAKAEAALGPIVGRGWVHWGRRHLITGVVSGYRHDDDSAAAPWRPGVVVFAAEVDAKVAGGLCMGWV